MSFELVQHISTTYGLYNTMIISLILIVPRMSMKKYLALTLSLMGVLYAVNMAAAFIWGLDAIAKYLFYTISIPSFIYFFLVAKYRDGRTIFAFCFGDMTILALGCAVGISSAALGFNLWVLFFGRLLIFPLAEFFMAKYLRPFYLELSNGDKGGWWLIAAVSALFYVVLMFLSGSPSPIATRNGDWPIYICVVVSMALTFTVIFKTLATQLKVIRYERTAKFMEVQIHSFENTIRTMEQNDKRLKIIRHDLRHYQNTLLSLAETGDIEEVRRFLKSGAEIVTIRESEKFSESVALNSMLSFYIELAREESCEVRTEFSLFYPLPVDDVELCIFFANAIENAINACKKIPLASESIGRKIKITCVDRPQFAIEVANTFCGEVQFSEKGFPVAPDCLESGQEKNHGYGTQSILAFAEKHNALLDYDAADGYFKVRMML